MRRARERERASIKNCDCSNVRELRASEGDDGEPRTQNPGPPREKRRLETRTCHREREESEKDSEEAPSVREHHQPGVEHDLRERIDSMSIRTIDVHLKEDGELTGNKI